jgi:hypothetical protein
MAHFLVCFIPPMGSWLRALLIVSR